MKAEKRIVKNLAAFALICGLSVSAHAQIGSGWTPDNETYIAQNSSGTTTTAISGGFEFTIPTETGLCRAEMRGNNLPTTTTNQWQGLGTLKSFPSGADKICMHQVFGPAPSTPDLILDEATYSGGIEIMSLEQSDAFEAQIQVGVQFQLNTIYDPVGNLITIYVNGTKTGTKTPNSGIHYNKFGQYVSESGAGPSTFDWVNVQSWAGGTASGGGGTQTVATPTFSPAGGTYTSTQSVSLSDSTSGATIYYTTNGSTPTTSSSKYSSAISVSSTTTIEAIGVLSGDNNSSVASATYTISSGGGTTVATPTFSPAGGTYTSTQSVSLSDSTSGATIYYTTNGSTPTTSSTVYSGAISVSSTTTIEAIAAKSGDTTSGVASATYTISTGGGGNEPAPTFSEPTGTYSGEVHTRIKDSDANAAIYYTTNGSTPTSSSTPNPDSTIEFKTTTTLKSIAIDNGVSSPVTTAVYTID
jgi:hypothetical protein